MNELKHPSCISYYLHETAVYFSQTLFRFYASVSYCFLSVDLVVMSRDHCFNQFYHLRRYRRHSTARNVQSEALVRHPLVPKVIYLAPSSFRGHDWGVWSRVWAVAGTTPYPFQQSWTSSSLLKMRREYGCHRIPHIRNSSSIAFAQQSKSTPILNITLPNKT